nr:hypothetical protein [Marinicella sp. W31]MDC2879169.1 hypothetical protein [Marinicella sp. W31]
MALSVGQPQAQAVDLSFLRKIDSKDRIAIVSISATTRPLALIVAS